jgi:hypothetical protein
MNQNLVESIRERSSTANQKQEFPMAAIFVNESELNQQSL